MLRVHRVRCRYLLVFPCSIGSSRNNRPFKNANFTRETASIPPYLRRRLLLRSNASQPVGVDKISMYLLQSNFSFKSIQLAFGQD